MPRSKHGTKLCRTTVGESRSEFREVQRRRRGAPATRALRTTGHKSADTSADVLADGQLSGLSAQAASGHVHLAFVFIGGNDFRQVFTSPDPVTTLGTVVPQAVTNVYTAVNTLLGTPPDMKVVLATVPKVSVLPEVKGAIAAGVLPKVLADAVDLAIGAFDEQIRNLAAASPRVALADVDALVGDIFSPAKFTVGGVTIDRETPSDQPFSLFLADGIHAGTVGQGLLANLFVDAIDDEFRGHIKPLSSARSS